jgi:hypothetical protein
MTTKRITSGWRGLSTAKEAAYGTPAAIATAFNFEGAPTDVEVNESQTDEQEITGSNEPAKHEILNWKLDSQHVQRALPHNLAWFLGAVMGKVTSAQPDNVNDPTVWRHFFERDLVNVALPSFTLIENDGVGQKRYPGIFGKTLKLTGERNDFLKMEAGFGGMGKEETDITAKPAVVAESYLRYGDVNFTRGGSLSGTVAGGTLAVTGGSTFKADLRNFEWTIDNQAIPIYEMGDNSGFVTRVERGDRFTHDLKAVLEMQDDAHKTGLINGTEYVLNIPIEGNVIPGGSGAFQFTCELIFPKVVYREAKKDVDGRSVIVNADFQVLEDSTYGSIIAKIINEQSAYLS